MAYDEFFTDQDKPYAENLNDSLILTDAFDISVPVEMPTMFSNGEFNSTLNMTRKCNVGLVTLKSVDTGVTIGTDSITGTGEVVFRVYPNFNCFYKWDKILLENTGNVKISFRKVDGTEITASVGSDGVISENNALKQLQEIDVVFTLNSAVISKILIWFINNQGVRNRTGAKLEASQLVNVNGVVASGNGEAVNGGTVKTALDNLHTAVTSEIGENIDNLHTEITGEIEDEIESIGNDLDFLRQIIYNTDPSIIINFTGSIFDPKASSIVHSGDVICLWGDNTVSINGFKHNYTNRGNYVIQFKGKITSIEDSCFMWINGLTSITIPNSVTSIGRDCFLGCYDLTSVTIPDSVTSIEYNCFGSCFGLTSIVIPKSVTSIGRTCFADCNSLTSVILNWTSNPVQYDSTWFYRITVPTLSIPSGTKQIYIDAGYPTANLVER